MHEKTAVWLRQALMDEAGVLGERWTAGWLLLAGER